MPDDNSPRELYIFSFSRTLELGGTAKLLYVAKDLSDAKSFVEQLSPEITGKILIAERTILYDRRPAVENVEVGRPLIEADS